MGCWHICLPQVDFSPQFRILKENQLPQDEDLLKILCDPAKIVKISILEVLRRLNILGDLRQIQWQYSQIETGLADVTVRRKAAIKGYGSFTEQTGHHDRRGITTPLCTITSERFPLTVISPSLSLVTNCKQHQPRSIRKHNMLGGTSTKRNLFNYKPVFWRWQTVSGDVRYKSRDINAVHVRSSNAPGLKRQEA